MQIRVIIIVLALLAFLSTATGGYLYFSTQMDYTVKDAHKEAMIRTKIMATHIASSLSGYQKAVKALAGLSEVEDLLAGSAVNADRANRTLDQFQEALQVSVCYLMNGQGETIATSNRKAADSFLGKNYRFRPYFRQAMAGAGVTYMAIGVTSKVPGVYVSHPVLADDGTILGVAALKTPIDPLSEILKEPLDGIALLTDANGVVFAASQEEMLFHSLWPLAPQIQSALVESRQFGEKPIPWLGLQQIDHMHVVDQAGKRFAVHTADVVNCPGWQVVYLHDLEGLASKVVAPLRRSFGTLIVLLCLFVGLGVMVLYRIASRDILRRKHAEEALALAHDELEARVLARTEALRVANEQLHDEVEERRRAEEARRASEERLSQIIAGNSIPTFVIDGNHVITHWNKACEKLLGYRAEEMIGTRRQHDIFYPRPRPTMADLVADCAHEEELTKHYGTKFRRSVIMDSAYEAEDYFPNMGDGKWIFFAAVPLRDTAGAVIGAIETLQDTTARRQMEQEMLKIQKLESLGVLAGGIAHDFNNLLAGILGNIGLARLYSQPGDKVIEKLVQAEKAAMRAKDLTQQLLTFSKGGEPITQAMFIGDMLRDSASFILRGGSIRCTFAIQEGLWPVVVDSGQISQVVQNLVKNAQEAMANGGDIVVGAANVELKGNIELPLQAGRYVTVYVEDQGEGIPVRHLAKIFDPYFTTKKSGTGLGLAVCFSIIQKHGGHLMVESGPGKTVFRFYLPAVSVGQVATKALDEPEAFHIGGGRILVMDDEEIVRETTREMLTNMGYEVVLASDGAEAVTQYRTAMAENDPFRAVIMDLTVPGGLGGLEALAQLQQLDPEVKAIVSSGYANAPVMANYKAHGFCGVLVKPYRPFELGQLLAMVFGKDGNSTA